MSDERHILVTNDDGIEAPGLWKLAEAMAEFGRVMIVAPATEASGAGTMVTYRSELQVVEVPERIPGVKAYKVDGTPADCVLIGLRKLKQGWISILAAGINPGANLGADFFLSGTCGAALMGAFRNVTSIAFSQDLLPTDEGAANPHWETSAAVARMVVRRIDEGKIPEGSFLNVNMPARPLNEVEGVAITRVAPGGYVHLSEKGDGIHEKLERTLVVDLRHAHEGTDIRAVVDGYVSISPLDTALTHEEHHRFLSETEAELTAALRSA